MPSLTKAFTAIGIVLLCALQLHSQTVTILESQTSHPLQNMDARWESQCIQLGYTTQIQSYDFLNNSCLIDLTDILIVASAIIDIDAAQVENIKTFVESGGSLYLQGEYLGSFPGNQIFTEVAYHFGDSFSWGSIENENIGPLGVGNALNSNPNVVDSLDYFWYGIEGSGVGPFTTILSKPGKGYGFIYEPVGAYNGKVMCMSDQDWIRLDFAPGFFENMATALPIPAKVFPTIFINSNDQNFCVGGNANFQSAINMAPSNIPAITYQWMVNGTDLPGETASELNITTLQDGDVVECKMEMTYGCKTYNHVSNPILMSPIFPISTANIDLEIIQVSSCADVANEFEINIANPDGVQITSIEWSWNNIVLNNSMSNTLSINDLSDGDQLSIRYSIMDPCYGETWIDSDDITVNITTPLVTSINMQASVLDFCAGDPINYTITGDNWGTNPTIEWIVNGLPSSVTSTSFDASGLQAGLYTLQANVQSSETCITDALVQTTPIVLQINPLQTLQATLSTANTNYCANEMATFTIDPIFVGNNAVITWMIDGVAISHQGMVYETNTLTDGQIVSASISANDACYTADMIILDPIAVSISDIETPYIVIDADISKVCPGTDVSLSASGDFWGSTPQLNWYVNGTLQNTQGTNFNYLIDEPVTTIFAQVVSDLACVSNVNANSVPLMIETAPMEVELLEITAEHCSQRDGEIKLEVNGGFGVVDGIFNSTSEGFTANSLAAGDHMFIAEDSLGCSVEKTLTVPAEAGPAIENLYVVQPNCTDKSFGESIVQIANSDDLSIYWMDENQVEFAEGKSVNSLTPGTYTVEVLDNYGCMTEESFEIESTQPIFTIGNQEIEIDLGERTLLDPNAVSTSANLTYSWSGNGEMDCLDCETITVEPIASTRYEVTITSETGCTTTTNFLVRVRKNFEVYLPNAFSPNGDGSNDLYTIGVGNEVEAINSVSIFNRWGALVYKGEDLAKDQSEGWDGMFKGKLSESGVYIVMVEVTYIDGEKQIFNGDLVIVK